MRIYSLQEAQEEKDLETSRIWVGNNRLSKKGNEHIVFQHKCHSNINIFLSNWHFFFKPYSAVGKLIRSNHILCSKNSCILLRTLVACGQKIDHQEKQGFPFALKKNISELSILSIYMHSSKNMKCHEVLSNIQWKSIVDRVKGRWKGKKEGGRKGKGKKEIISACLEESLNSSI